MQERLNQLQVKLEADSAWAEKILSLEEAVDVQDLLKENGMQFTLAEIGELKAAITASIEKEPSGEMTDENLESVAGGVFNPLFLFGPGAPVMLANIKRGRW